MLAHEGVSERGDTWALGPFSAHRQVAPDVRATGRMSGVSRRAGCPGREAGCPGWLGAVLDLIGQG